MLAVFLQPTSERDTGNGCAADSDESGVTSAQLPANDIPIYEELWRSGQLAVQGLMSDTIPLDEINSPMDGLGGGNHWARSSPLPKPKTVVQVAAFIRDRTI